LRKRHPLPEPKIGGNNITFGTTYNISYWPTELERDTFMQVEAKQSQRDKPARARVIDRLIGMKSSSSGTILKSYLTVDTVRPDSQRWAAEEGNMEIFPADVGSCSYYGLNMSIRNDVLESRENILRKMFNSIKTISREKGNIKED
jgi:hypothetical protein